MTTNTNLKKGDKVRTTAPVRALGPGFPGWGKPGELDHFIDHPAGMVGTVYSVQSHGIAPFTRFCVKFDDGSRTTGTVDVERTR